MLKIDVGEKHLPNLYALAFVLHTATDDIKSLPQAQNTIELSDARQNLSQYPQKNMPLSILITIIYQFRISRHSCLSL